MGKGFTLNNGQGAWLSVEAVHLIAPSRCKCPGTNCAVIIGLVTVGTIQPGDKIIIQDAADKELLEDYIARLEINCKQHFEARRGNRVGMLLKQHAPKDLLDLGIPRHQVHHPPAAHPYRM